jgi:hypothetical protein
MPIEVSTDNASAGSAPASHSIEVPDDLVRRLMEIIEWRKSGIAELPALQAYVDANLSHLGDVDTLRIAEDRTLMEAARLLVAMADKSDD